jgi:DNA helicase-2/ATP-dependent DNA helicase PcrA
MTGPDPRLLADLTEPQREAVTHRDGPLLVLAGPGSGKTTVVTRRVAHLIACGVPAWSILALTFTNKAAGEMRERIEKLLPDNALENRGPTVATFHAFCARTLRRFADAAGLPPRYSIYDAADQREAIKQAIQDAELSARNWTPAAIATHVSHAKNRLLDAEDYGREADDYFTRTVAKIYRCYEHILRANDALDFDDLLLCMADLLAQHDEVRGRLQDRYRYLLVDEYQDTNHAQFVIAHTLAAAHRNICVVGDPDQSIYGWRGADIGNILEFEDHYPEATVVPLGQNFRSTGHIVAASAGLIAHNRRRKPKRLHTELDEGRRPTVVICRNEHHEAALVADFLRRQFEEEEVPWREMAVLYRLNALSRVLEEAFRQARIPYVIARGTAFYERKEVKEALAYLRLVVNPNDELALRRVINTPARGIGKTSLQKVETFAIQQRITLAEALRRAAEVPALTARAAGSVGKFAAMMERFRAGVPSGSLVFTGPNPMARIVEQVIRESGLEAMYAQSRTEEDKQRLANLSELVSAAAQFEPRERVEGEEPSLVDMLGEFLESVALVSDADMVDPKRGAVTLMTLHAAKGLEFTALVVVGLEEGLLPHARAAENERELEEERRLCYVGMTRARRELMLTRAAARTLRGILERTIQSRFLDELPADAVVGSDQAGLDVPLEETAEDVDRRARAGGFKVGCIVRHPKFGLGRVESILHRASGASAQVMFPTAGTKTLILEHAPLERVD